MQEVYAALMLHESGKAIDIEGVKKILESAGANVDEGKIKVLVSSLEGVNIDEALKEAVSLAAAPAVAGPAVEKKEEKSAEEEAKAAESASAGLSSLFG